MATIQGQNLRLFVRGLCVAAARSATFHVAANFEDGGTKDDTNKWAVNEPTGVSWDASVEALVRFDDYMQYYRTCSTEVTTFEDHITRYLSIPQYTEDRILLSAGQSIAVWAQTGPVGICTYGSGTGLYSLLKESGDAELTFTNETGASLEIFICSRYNGDQVAIHVFNSNTPVSLEVGQKVQVSFSKTIGAQNRQMQVPLWMGEAIISDMQINAQNRQSSTYTCQLTGVGTLTQSTQPV